MTRIWTPLLCRTLNLLNMDLMVSTSAQNTEHIISEMAFLSELQYRQVHTAIVKVLLSTDLSALKRSVHGLNQALGHGVDMEHICPRALPTLPTNAHRI